MTYKLRGEKYILQHYLDPLHPSFIIFINKYFDSQLNTYTSTKEIIVHLLFLLIMISLSKFLSDNLFLLAEVLSPVVEKIRSTEH